MQTDTTLLVGIMCLAHCVIELLADDTTIPISFLFRAFIYLIVFFNFLQAYISAGGEMPSKIKYVASGYFLYTTHVVVKFMLGHGQVPELISDVALCQYYLMTLLTFMIHTYFSEIYIEVGAAKISYSRKRIVAKDV